MAKIGRNALCPCGSGKKFKHCHGAFSHQAHIAQSIQYGLVRAEAQHIQRERQQGLGKPIISAEALGRRFVAVKNRLMHSNSWKTFHDFLGDYIKMALGPEWGTTELQKPQEERHPILVWYHLVCDLQREHIKQPGTINQMPQTGAAAAYLHLAYDLYALDHNAELQEKLVGRLRDRDNFAGARYEVFVAATLIRAGFELAFEDEDDRNSSHCEFVATHKRTGRKFSVEAKHRAGTKFRLGRQLNRALAKEAYHPRIIFIDINIPDRSKTNDEPDRIGEALTTLRSFEGKLINGKPLPDAYVFVTNVPWHHHLLEQNIRCEILIEGFQIPDFKGDVPAPSLRAAIDAREKHIEMHELLGSLQDHMDIPVTFDGQIPEFAFGNSQPRLMIGDRYPTKDENGVEQVGTLTSATVVEKDKLVWGVLSLDDGTSVMTTWPLSDSGLEAWRRHPDTFFGKVEQRKRQVTTLLELYDFFFSSYIHTPRERLLEMLAGAPDIEDLRLKDQPALASIYAERTALTAWASNPPTPPR